MVTGSRRRAAGGGLLLVLVLALLATTCSLVAGSHASRQGSVIPRSSGCPRTAEPGASPTTSRAGAPLPPDPTALRTASVRVDGRTGTYLIGAAPPASYGAVPLVVLFHGAGVDAAYIARLTELPVRGASRGILVAVPNSEGGSWDAAVNGTDGHLVGAMLSSIERQYCVDQTRVSLVGLSSGAVFAIRYACSHAGEFASVATVAVEYQLGCTHPLSLLAFHGTADPTVPYGGAPGDAVPGLRATGTLANMAAWGRLDRCGRTPELTRVSSQVERRTWTGCTAGTEVVLYTIVGGGHTWPDADQAPRYGMTTHQLDATTEALDFFASHTTQP